MSISVMGLSSEPFESDYMKDYQRLCYSTSEGIYLNMVDKGERGNRAATRFLSAMDVYPTARIPIMKEVIQGLWEFRSIQICLGDLAYD